MMIWGLGGSDKARPSKYDAGSREVGDATCSSRVRQEVNHNKAS